MSRWFSAIVVGLFCWSVGLEASALNITLDSKSIPGLTPKAPLVAHTVRITGRFEQGDGDKLRMMLAGLKAKTARITGQPLATAELSSSGGDLFESLKVGYLFREFEVATLVRKGDICLSACAMAFLGGTASRMPPLPIPSRTIEIGGQVGFHNFTLDATVVQSETKGDTTAGIARGFGLGRAGASALIRYAADLGIDAGFMAQLLVSPPDTWLYIDTDELFLTVGACPRGPEPPLGRLEQQVVNICNHASGGAGVAEASQGETGDGPRSQALPVGAGPAEHRERQRQGTAGRTTRGRSRLEGRPADRECLCRPASRWDRAAGAGGAKLHRQRLQFRRTAGRVPRQPVGR
jgi:hypothetical protein